LSRYFKLIIKDKQYIMPKKILEYWETDSVESMYDKYLLNLEINLIRDNIPPNSKILDAGCGEGEGTLVYSKIDNVSIHAADFSDTRLEKASKRLEGCDNVILKKVDFLDEWILDRDYDLIISQRFLINMPTWEQQQKVLADMMNALKLRGKLILLEGSVQGVIELDDFRKLFDLDPLPVKWHNNFIDDNKLIEFLGENGLEIIHAEGTGAYFLLTRGIRPIFEKELNWDCRFNEISSARETSRLLGLNNRFSRLKLWVFSKK